jgi:eukaryotic-like serine/threonine-protein kinase
MNTIVVSVIEGPEAGRRFEFPEADNFIVGRDDPRSSAHLRLSPEDRYVSRHHFVVEVRPPNVQVTDAGSANGTWVMRRGEREWTRVEETRVEDGDRIKAGHTVLEISSEAPAEPQQPASAAGTPTAEPQQAGPESAPGPEPPASEPNAPGPEPSASEPNAPGPEPSASVPPPVSEPSDPCAPVSAQARCIRCRRPIEMDALAGRESLKDVDFMCEPCRQQVEAEKAEAAEHEAVQAECMTCGRDLSDRADADGRAAEFSDIALYLCEVCAQQGSSVGRRIGSYETVRSLGAGGMGEVWLAVHSTSRRVSAVKDVLPIHNGNDDLRMRFLREAAIMQDLRHPNIARWYESGLVGDSPYFASEFVPGGDLSKFISREGETLEPIDEVTSIIAEALVGLAHMHRAGYVHRDLKPENILLRNTGEGPRVPKITDVGLARSYERHGGTLSKTGSFAGTQLYMPPEQINDFKGCKPGVDVYAMGVTTYYLLTARTPFDFPTPWQIEAGRYERPKKDAIRITLEDEPLPIRRVRPDVPERLAEVIDRAIVKDPARRYADAAEMHEAFVAAME